MGMAYCELKEHKDKVCKKYPIPCPNKCGEKGIKREDMEAHMKNKCSRGYVKCRYKKYGCHKEFMRRDKKRHYDRHSADHIDLLEESYCQLQDFVRKQFPAFETICKAVTD